jgi:hypothetical protein
LTKYNPITPILEEFKQWVTRNENLTIEEKVQLTNIMARTIQSITNLNFNVATTIIKDSRDIGV